MCSAISSLATPGINWPHPPWESVQQCLQLMRITENNQLKLRQGSDPLLGVLVRYNIYYEQLFPIQVNVVVASYYFTLNEQRQEHIFLKPSLQFILVEYLYGTILHIKLTKVNFKSISDSSSTLDCAWVQFVDDRQCC